MRAALDGEDHDLLALTEYFLHPLDKCVLYDIIIILVNRSKRALIPRWEQGGECVSYVIPDSPPTSRK